MASNVILGNNGKIHLQVCGPLPKLNTYFSITVPDIGLDACTFPVLSPNEAAELASSGATPLVHPRLSRSAVTPLPSDDFQLLRPGENTTEILNELGVTPEERTRLVKDGVLMFNKYPKLWLRYKATYVYIVVNVIGERNVQSSLDDSDIT